MSEEDEGVEIRPAREEDGEAIVELFVAVNREMAPREMREDFETYIELSLKEEIRPFLDYYDPAVGNGLWVAVVDGEMAGMYGLERVGVDEVELRRMYVAPAHRRKGLARKMLRHSEEMAELRGYTRMILSTSEIQEAALELYRAEGFTFVRKEEAQARSNKTIGGGIVRFHFEKNLSAGDAE